jgi:lipopolysaccharide export system protein LptA
MRADRAGANYAAGGGIEEVQAHGQVDFRGQGPQSNERLTCRKAVFFFERPLGVLKRVVATGAPQLVVETPTETRSLRAPRLELMLAADATGQQILTASQRGTLEVRQESGGQRSVTGNRLRVEFAEGQLQAIDASGEVETHERRPDGQRRTTRSEELRSRFESGTLAAAQQWGRFGYDDGRWQAAAGRAEYTQTRGTVVLTEKPVLWDESSRTRARVIEVVENSGDLRAHGGVRTTRRGAAGDSDGFGTGEPVQLAAERLYVWPEEGRARYEGQARLWQGENRLAAETIELFGEPDRLSAEGEVSALFFDAQAEGKQEERRPVRVTSERFHYRAAERRAVFSGSVVARNDFGTLVTPRLEAFLTGESGSGAGRLERVRAHEDVRLEQGGYKATSEEGEYRADAQTVVLWGGTPTIHHPERGTTTGARLTLFLADDTLLVDSAQESRTVTRRPWAQ